MINSHISKHLRMQHGVCRIVWMLVLLMLCVVILLVSLKGKEVV